MRINNKALKKEAEKTANKLVALALNLLFTQT